MGLDIQTRTRIWDYLRQLNRDEKLTIFMTTHYLEEADHLSDRIAIMDHGAIKVSGSPSELKQSLRGDVLTIEVNEAGPDLRDFLENIAGVSEVSRDGNGYRMKVSRVEAVLPPIVTGIASMGLRIRSTSFNEPSMDEVFLDVTGRSMRDAQEGTAVQKGQIKKREGEKE